MLQQLKLLIQSGHALVSIETHDEPRATETVRRAADELGMPLFEWTVTAGLRQTRPFDAPAVVEPGKAASALDYIVAQQDTRAVYLFKDLGAHCRDAYVARMLRDLHARPSITLVLVDIQPLADNIRRLTVPLQLKLPDVAELEQVVRGTFREIRERSYAEVKHSLTQRNLEQMVQTLRGLTAAEAARVIAAAIHDDGALTPEDVPRIVEHKRNLLQSTGCLESIAVDVSLDEMGGLSNLKRWLAKRRGGMYDRAGVWPGAAAGDAAVGRAGLREEFVCEDRGGELGAAAVADGSGRALSEVHRREREPAARGAYAGGDDGACGAVDR